MTRQRATTAFVVATLASLGALSCATGGAADAIRPRESSATNALGEDAPCRDVDGEAHPLVVDWRPEDRGDLEIAMKDGVAVVSYDCRAIRLLRDCRVEGKYGFVGTSSKERVLRLESADEIRANLPFAGAALAGKLGSELARSSTLDVALVIVGRTATTWRAPTRADLSGDCEGATHFVRAAYLGAFAMATGTKARAAAAAEMFGASTAGSSASARSMESRDGNLDACRQATSDAKAPPGRCAATLRLELARIRVIAPKQAPQAKNDGTRIPDAKPVDDGCPRGMVLSENKCTAAADATRFACDPGDVSVCTEQCDKGDARSCFNLGYLYDEGKGVAEDDAKANALYLRACDAGFTRGCVQLAQFYGDEDKTPDYAKAFTFATKACDAGEPEGCTALGVLHFEGHGTPKSSPKALALYRRACDGGDPRGCKRAAYLYGRGLDDIAVDYAKSTDYEQRACDGGLVWGCIDAVDDLLRARSVARDARRALSMNQRLCDRYPEHCQFVGIMYARGEGTWKDDARAYAAFARGCEAKSERACAYEAAMRLEGRGAPADEDNALAVLKNLCDKSKEEIACARVGFAHLEGRGTKKDPKVAFAIFEKVCADTNNFMACADAGLLALQGTGTVQSKEKARRFLERGCAEHSPWSERDPRACRALAEAFGAR